MAGMQKPQGYGITELLPEPKAVPGCGACLDICVRRKNARSRNDYSAVSDVNVELRRHHVDAHTS
jgi:hypothetical protein